MDTIYKKLKINFAMHSQEGLKYLRECYDIINNMHNVANEPMDVTFEEYCIMYNEAIATYGYDHTHNGLHIYDKERLKSVHEDLLRDLKEEESDL